MIKFTLKCDQDHQFESWFQSSDAFEKLAGAGMVNCAVCGSAQVTKAIMAPRVQAARNKANAVTSEPENLPVPTTERPLSQPQNAAEEALKELRRQVEENSEYVGLQFTQQARAMHAGETPERPIYGEAKAEDAKALIDEGVPVTPLPFATGRKTN